MLWAWERNEDLRFIQSNKIGVAYLAQTLIISESEIILRPRRQPLKINPETYLIAVTRIETNRPRSDLAEDQLDAATDLIVKTSLKENIKGIQIDFDVKVSEREFYKKLIKRIKGRIAQNKTLTITALASFCLGDRWMKDLPIDEAVPMLFEMGADRREIIKHMKSGKDFEEPLCRKSYGIAIYEPQDISFKQNRTRYYFNARPWKSSDLEKLK